MIGGMGLKHAVLNNRHIGVRALGDNIAPMEHGLIAPGHRRALGCHTRGQQIQSLNIAMEEARILCGNQIDFFIGILYRTGGQHNPQIGRYFVRIRIRVVAHRGATGHLPIDELLAAVHFFHHLRKQGTHLRLGLRQANTQKCRTVIEAIQMLIQRINHMIAAVSGIIATIAEKAHTIQHGHLHFLQRAKLTVVVT